MTGDTIRLSVPVEIELNDRLSNYLIPGTKAAIVRALLNLLLDTQKNYPNQHICEALLRGQVKMSVQNLNKESDSDTAA